MGNKMKTVEEAFVEAEEKTNNYTQYYDDLKEKFFKNSGVYLSALTVLLLVMEISFYYGYGRTFGIAVTYFSLSLEAYYNVLPLFFFMLVLGGAYIFDREIDRLCGVNEFKKKRAIILFFFILGIYVYLYSNFISSSLFPGLWYLLRGVLFAVPFSLIGEGGHVVMASLNYVNEKKRVDEKEYQRYLKQRMFYNIEKVIPIRRLISISFILVILVSVGDMSGANQRSFEEFSYNDQKYVVIVDYKEKALVQRAYDILDHSIVIDLSDYQIVDKTDKVLKRVKYDEVVKGIEMLRNFYPDLANEIELIRDGNVGEGHDTNTEDGKDESETIVIDIPKEETENVNVDPEEGTVQEQDFSEFNTEEQQECKDIDFDPTKQ